MAGVGKERELEKRRKKRKEERDKRLKFIQINIKTSIKPQTSRNTTNNLSDNSIQVYESWSLFFFVPRSSVTTFRKEEKEGKKLERTIEHPNSYDRCHR